jgi:hypothetical protein
MPKATLDGSNNSQPSNQHYKSPFPNYRSVVGSASQERPTPKPPPATDTVQISYASRALQQRTEAAAQTVQDAAAGDMQAKAELATQVVTK